MFKVNNKETRTTSGDSVSNLEQTLQFILLLLLLNLNKYSKIIDSGNKFVFNNCEKMHCPIGWENFAGLHVFILIHQTQGYEKDTFSQK